MIQPDNAPKYKRRRAAISLVGGVIPATIAAASHMDPLAVEAIGAYGAYKTNDSMYKLAEWHNKRLLRKEQFGK